MCISRARRSVSLPFPSSPHWVPTTTVAGTRLSVRQVASDYAPVYPSPKWGSECAGGFGVRSGGGAVGPRPGSGSPLALTSSKTVNDSGYSSGTTSPARASGALGAVHAPIRPHRRGLPQDDLVVVHVDADRRALEGLALEQPQRQRVHHLGLQHPE